MNESIERYIDRLLNESSPEAPIWNIERARNGSAPHWNYIDGCMLLALWELYKQTKDDKYAKFCDGFVDYYIDGGGVPLGYKIEDYNLDNICPGRLLFDLIDYTGKEKYKKAVDILYGQIKAQPRTIEGSFWHKLIYPNQVWLDGLFMAQPFYTRYALTNGKTEILDDVISQFKTARLRLYDDDTGLYRHGYDASKKAFWADETGKSACTWVRSLGWFTMALVDVAELLPESSGRDELVKMLADLLDRVGAYCDQSSGMYYQVTDQGDRAGNYLESSGSSMIARAMLKAAKLGFVSNEFHEKGLKTFKGICGKYLSESNGILNLGGICLVAGLGPENNRRRDGSYDYYISEPIVENDAKGVAPFLMCYTAYRE